MMVLALITILGIPLGLTVYLLYQIIKDPNKVDKYIALITKPIYYITKWWSKKYVGAEISYQITEFFNRHIIKNIANQTEVKININWIIDEEDPILKEDNTVIICLKKDKDQARNILKAAETSIPIVTLRNLRSNIKTHVAKSIDLVTMRNLANKLGNHGKYAYKKYFLSPSIVEDERISELFQKLAEIDNRGYFVPIFLNELEYIGDGLYAQGDTTDYSNEIIGYIEYLIQIARIEVGDEVKQWSYFSKLFNAGIILLANNDRMIRQGVKPYLDRITTKLKQGHESIYILSEENSWEFLKRYENSLSENDRILIKGNYQANGIVANDEKRKSNVKIVLLRKIDIYVDDLFKEKILASNIEVGKQVDGEVTDVYEENAIVSLMGIDAFIKKNECTWNTIQTCTELLNVGEKKSFLVKKIDENKLSIELSLRLPDEHPWDVLPKLKEGDRLETTILFKNGMDYISQDSKDREIIIPINEISWIGLTDEQIASYIGKKIEVVIYKADNECKKYIGSIKRLENDPWPDINKRIKPDFEFIGKVTEVNHNFIRVDIENGLNGIIPKERLLEVGGVYTDFFNNLVIGQGIEVVVTRVFVKKAKIHLDLKN